MKFTDLLENNDIEVDTSLYIMTNSRIPVGEKPWKFSPNKEGTEAITIIDTYKNAERKAINHFSTKPTEQRINRIYLF
jgi:hypothetical protein